jgi:uncharacterized protein (UPF0335 family)
MKSKKSKGEDLEPTAQLLGAMKTASSLANSSTARAFFDRVTGFRISRWEGEGAVVKQQILDEYEEAKKNGVKSIAEASNLRQAANLIM